ncbi:MAG TPA: NACHT domain-containing protein, partial [Candidatus Hydrogenedentes bacterium]|nr:NACHT domain-containing protein [Candidatus Hydrogenedentota bacterium]
MVGNMVEQLPGPTEKKTLTSRLGFDDEPGKAKSYLSATLAFVKTLGAEELKRVPVAGAAVAALEKLSAAEDARKLDGDIEQILTTSERTQEGVDLLGKAAACILALQLEQGALLARFLAELERRNLPHEPQQIADFAKHAAIVAYRDRVALEYLYADYRGVADVTREGHAASFHLDDVYVIPRATHRESADERPGIEAALLERLEQPDEADSPGERARFEEEYAALGSRRGRTPSDADRSRPVFDLLRNARHAVLLGGPGAGKTVLTKYLARTCALGPETCRGRFNWQEDLVPVVIPLAAFADARTRQPTLTLRAFLDQRLIEAGGDALRQAMAEQLERGNILILLDGVDEAPDTPTRIDIVKEVDRFIADHHANRCIVTSRPHGYVRLAGELPHFTLADFSKDQVKEFAGHWHRAFETRQRPDAPDLAHADREAAEMFREIEANPKVAELATNPLMLVIIALIRHDEARLPDERVRLYEKAVATLMETWNRCRSLANVDVGGATLPLNHLISVWGAVAEWARREKPTGMMHRGELERRIVHILEERELDDEDAAATAESYLNAAVERAGLIEERATNIFAFWHPTFEEYLAAVELVTPTGKVVARLLPLRNDPRWREVIRLAVGYVGIIQHDTATATEMARAIADLEPGPLEPVLHTNLRLAADCVADNAGVRKSLADQIIRRLGVCVGQQPYATLADAFIQTTRGRPLFRPSPETMAALAPLENHDQREVRMEATRLFSNAAADLPEARNLCERMLKDTDRDVRRHAALGLLRAGDYRAELWVALGGASEVTHIEEAARQFGAALPAEASEAVMALLDDEKPYVRQRAVSALARLGASSPEVVAGLLARLDDENSSVRSSAADALGRLAASSPEVAAHLLARLDDEKSSVRWSAAEALARLGASSPEVVARLLARL